LEAVRSTIEKAWTENFSVTGVILNWKRPENVKRILDGWKRKLIVKEAIVVNNNPEHFFKHDWATCLNLTRDCGLYTRFTAAELASYEEILIQDDDIELPSETINSLYRAYIREPEIIHGLYGRNGGQHYTYTNVMGEVPIVLTRAMVFNRLYAGIFFNHIHYFDDLQVGSNPYGNGEDIIFSYIVRSVSGKLNKAYPLTCTQLSNKHSISGRAGHKNHRTRVLQECEKWLAATTKQR
jgi:hypothetical protein